MATGPCFPKPIFLHNSKLKPRIPISFPASRLVISVGFGFRKEFEAMRELVKTSAFSGANSEESVGICQQETAAFVESSSREIPTKFMAQGFEALLNRQSKWILSAIFCAVIIWRHDGEALWAIMGSVLNSILSHTLKWILNQERPTSTLRTDPGMPSSHGQSIFFIVAYVILSFVEWLGVNEISMSLSVLALAIGSYLSWLRVSQGLHTINQVAVGAAVGTVFAVLWFCSWKAFVLKAFDSFLWVRIILVLGAATFSLGFLAYVIRHWLSDER